MDASKLHSIIQRLQTGDTVSSERELESYRQANPEQLISSLIEVITNSKDSSIPTIQSALFILKICIKKNWSVGFEDFVGPPINQGLKSEVRSLLVNHLIGHDSSKVRSASALLISQIASTEYPDEWPDLIDRINQLISSGSKSQLFGALTTLHELIGETISDVEFPQVGKSILNHLFQVASSPTYPERDNQQDQYSSFASAVAISIFTQCSDLLLIPDDHSANTPALTTLNETIEQWAPLLIKYIGFNAPADNFGWVYIKIEATKAFTSLYRIVPKHLANYSAPAIENVLSNMSSMIQVYNDTVITDTTDLLSTPQNQAVLDLIFIPDNINLEFLVFEELELLEALLTRFNLPSLLISSMNDIINLLIQYAQISKEMEELWVDDMNEYVREETELSLGRSVRAQVQSIILPLSNNSSLNALSVLAKTTIDILNQESASWKLKECALYLFAMMLYDSNENRSTISKEFINNFVQQISSCHYDSVHPLLRARSLLAGASVCKSLKDIIDVPTITIPLFEATLNFAISDNNDTVKSAGILSFQNFCKLLPKEYLDTKVDMMYGIISKMIPEAAEETPAAFAEVLVEIIQANISQAVRNPNIMHVIYSLLAKDPTNVMLTNEVDDVIDELTEEATNQGIYNQFVQYSLPPLLDSILSIKNWDYTPELVISMTILGIIIDKGPYPVPTEIVDTFFEPLCKIVMNSSDSQVLQTVTENLSFLTKHASEQISSWNKGDDGRNGIELLIMSVARLLEPIWEDSACINTGLLIVAIVEQFGSSLGSLLEHILEATSKRLLTAKHPVLIENLIQVFSKLIETNPSDVVNFLANQKIEIPNTANEEEKVTSGLQVVISKWVSNFDVLRGYDEIKQNIMSLGKLYELQDERVAKVIVEGDPVSIPQDIILTRSKARELKNTYTQIPATLKIIKLFLRELITGNFTLKDAASAYSQSNVKAEADFKEDDENDEWEDIEELVPLEGGLSYKDALKYGQVDDIDLFEGNYGTDMPQRGPGGTDHTTQLMIAQWLQQVVKSDIGNFKDVIYPGLSKSEQDFLKTIIV